MRNAAILLKFVSQRFAFLPIIDILSFAVPRPPHLCKFSDFRQITEFLFSLLSVHQINYLQYGAFTAARSKFKPSRSIYGGPYRSLMGLFTSLKYFIDPSLVIWTILKPGNSPGHPVTYWQLGIQIGVQFLQLREAIN